MRPAWQNKLVNKYLSLPLDFPLPSYWNSKGRGYPDISAIGLNYFVIWSQQIVPIGGTSSSGPVIGGILSLLNDIRLRKGLPTLGLVNPTLYSLAEKTQNGAYFNDVSVGTNYNGDLQLMKDPQYPTFCPYGFSTAVGWDAVTGLGSPNFKMLSEYFSQ